MESISLMTKKHCRSALSIISIIILAALVIVVGAGLYLLGFSYLQLFVLLSSLFLLVSAIIYATGSPLGCTLLRIPIIILTFISFISSLICIAVGYAFLNSENTEEFVNSILATYGYKLTVTANVVGMAFIVCGLVSMFLSFCLLSGVRYFSSIKRCLNGEIRRGGAKPFGYFAYLTFLLYLAVITAQFYLVWSSGDIYKMMSIHGIIIALEVILSCALLLSVGISANGFSKKTYAFKIFENQMMKVEKNADGTVYVPIQEENEELHDSIEGSNDDKKSKGANKSEDKKKEKTTKPFIPESQIIPAEFKDECHEKLNECDII